MQAISKLQEHNFVYVHDCMDAGGRAKQDARAEDVRAKAIFSKTQQ